MNDHADAPGRPPRVSTDAVDVSVSPAAVAANGGVIVTLLRELVAGQAEIIVELRSIRSELRRQAAAAPLADRLVAAVYALLGAEAFTAAQLLTLADSPLSTRMELRAVVEDLVRGSVDQPGGPRMLGKFLRANMQHCADGLQLVSLGKVREGHLYRVDVATKTRGGNAWADELLKGTR